MIDRLRSLLDRPLDPSAGRAIVVLASALVLVLGLLIALAGIEVAERPAGDAPAQGTAAPARSMQLPAEVSRPSAARPPAHRRQDPQDQPGSDAARRAAAALRSHRALQHVPYRVGELRITLAGARDNRALLRVSAPTVREAWRGWHWFLRRFRDSGRSYVPIFRGSRRGGG